VGALDLLGGDVAGFKGTEHALAHQRRQLKTQRFSAACRHDRKGVFAVRYGVDNFCLSGTESIKAEYGRK